MMYKNVIFIAGSFLAALSTGCSTYGDFGGGVTIGPVHVGGYVGWGTPPSGGGKSGTAATGTQGTTSGGGGTSGAPAPVNTRPPDGTKTTGTAVLENGGHYTAEVYNLPTSSGYVDTYTYNARLGDY